jgi:hypothetical protein
MFRNISTLVESNFPKGYNMKTLCIGFILTIGAINSLLCLPLFGQEQDHAIQNELRRQKEMREAKENNQKGEPEIRVTPEQAAKDVQRAKAYRDSVEQVRFKRQGIDATKKAELEKVDPFLHELGSNDVKTLTIVSSVIVKALTITDGYDPGTNYTPRGRESRLGPDSR